MPETKTPDPSPTGPAAPNDPDAWGDRLCRAIRRRNSAVCVGLDPRVGQLPPGLLGDGVAADDWAAIAEAYRTFCIGIIDAVADLVPAVKPQAAFFEQLGPAGGSALAAVIEHARRAGLAVILDGKRNDIGSTAEAYAAAYLGPQSPWACDALTVSPYLGDDSLDPFVEAAERTASGIFVLVKTSNPGGGFLQDRITDGEPLYRRVARWISETNASRLAASGYGPVGAVVGATYPDQLAELREALPGTMILVPGYGAQGGSAYNVAAGFDAQGLGAIVNNSRQILFAYRGSKYNRGNPAAWQDAARAATAEMNEQLNAVRARP